MAKNKGGKQKTKKPAKSRKKHEPKAPKKSIGTPLPQQTIVLEQSPTAPSKTTFKKFIEKNGGWIMITAAIIGILAAIKPVRDLFKSPHELYVEKKFVTGDLNLPLQSNIDTTSTYQTAEKAPIFTNTFIDSFHLIKGIYLKDFDKRTNEVVMLGSDKVILCNNEDFYKGIRIFTGLINPFFPDSDTACLETTLILAVRNNRLYVSTEFKDLLNGQTVGTIAYNHWELSLANMWNWYEDDDKLEVIDNQKHIVFSIKTIELQEEDMTMIKIVGYFINANSVLILPNDDAKEGHLCISKFAPNWQSVAEAKIAHIKSIF